MFSKDIGIDLGTANVLIYVKGQGIVLNEPSVIALDVETNKPLAVGHDARNMLGRTPGKVNAIRPMKDGVIADFDATGIMLDYFIKKVNGKSFLSKPRILICCPSNITQVEKNAIKEAAERTGAKKVFLEEEPKVAAVGAGLNIAEPIGNMVIDVGGGTTDIAVLSLGDIVTSSSIKVAGNKFDSDITNFIKNKYKLLIGDRTSEEIKFKIGRVYNESKNEKTVEKIDNSKNEVNKNQVVQTKKEQKPESNVGTKDTPINNKETQEKVKTEEIQKTQSNNTEEKNKEEKITEEYIYNDNATKKLINDINEIAKKNPDLWGTDGKKLYNIKVSRSLLGQNYMFPYNYKQVEGKVLNVFPVTFLVYAVDYKKTGFATETRYYIDIE